MSNSDSERAWKMMNSRMDRFEQELDHTAAANKADRESCIAAHDKAMSALWVDVKTNAINIGHNRIASDRAQRSLRDRALLCIALVAASMTALVALVKGIDALIDLVPKLLGLL